MPLNEVVIGVKNGEEPLVDIVAVHGLNPWNKKDHYITTWAKKSSTGSDSLWLRDHLPSVAPRARIFLYEYDSFPALSESRSKLVHEANNLLDAVEAERFTPGSSGQLPAAKRADTRPLIFVAHSLGGILVKQAIVNAFANDRDEGKKKIREAIRGLVFFGVPHAGGDEALVKFGRVATRIIDSVTASKRSDRMEAVKNGSIYSDFLAEEWRHRLADQTIVSFYEKDERIVSRTSATFGLPGDMEYIVELNASHGDMCKFDLNDPKDVANYKIVRMRIGNLYEKALQGAIQLPSVPLTNVNNTEPGALSNAKGMYGTQHNASMASALYIMAQREAEIAGASAINRSQHSPEFRLRDAAAFSTTMPLMFGVSPLIDPVTRTYIRTFKTFDYVIALEDLKRQRFTGTCNWFLANKTIKSWASQAWPTIVWFSGLPGLGKSTTLATLVADFQSNSNSVFARAGKVHYSFCAASHNSTASSVLCNIIHQLLIDLPELQSTIMKYDMASTSVRHHDWRADFGPTRPASVLWNLVCQIARNIKGGKIFLVIDALDQCDEDSQSDLIRFFSDVVRDGGSLPMRIIFSSRDQPNIRRSFYHWSVQAPQSWQHIQAEDYEDDIKADVLTYGRARVDGFRKSLSFSADSCVTINDHIEQTNSALFLPVALLFEQLSDGDDHTVTKILTTGHADLTQLYTELLDRIPDEAFHRSPNVLKHVVYCFQSLTTRDLCFASNGWVRSSTKHAQFIADLQRFKPLLRIDTKGDRVSLYHVSAKDFLIESSRSGNTRYQLPPSGQAHLEIALSCIKVLRSSAYLPFPDYRTSSAVQAAQQWNELSSREGLIYALKHWHKHLKAAAAEAENTEMSIGDTSDDATALDTATLTEALEALRSLLDLWHKALPGFQQALLDKSGVKQMTEGVLQLWFGTQVELLSGLGLRYFLEKFMSDPGWPIPDPPAVQSALRLAIRGGHVSVVKYLIERFKIQSLEDDIFGDTITDSAWANSAELMAIVTQMRPPKIQELAEALTAAFMSGKTATLRSLVGDGSIFRRRDSQRRTILHQWVISHSFSNRTGPRLASAIVAYILQEEHGVDINAKDRFGFTALHYLSWSSYLCTEELVRLFIAYGADLYSRTPGGLVPFHLAARFTAWPSVIRLFLEKDNAGLINVRSLGDNTPLHWSLSRHMRYLDDVEILDVLVNAGADPLLLNKKGVPPLSWSTSRTVTQLVVEALRDGEYQKAIKNASADRYSDGRGNRKDGHWENDNPRIIELNDDDDVWDDPEGEEQIAIDNDNPGPVDFDGNDDHWFETGIDESYETDNEGDPDTF